MATYQFQARDKSGQRVSGTVTAKTVEEAGQFIAQNQLHADAISEKGSWLQNIPFLNGVKLRDRAMFARQLATMMAAGVPILQALSILQQQMTSKPLSDAVTDMIHAIETGSNFSSALAKHDKIFDPVFIALVQVGEASGQLEQILLAMADRLENDTNFESKVKGALAYPAVILVVMIIMGILVTTKIIPQLIPLFQDTGTAIPMTTRILIFISKFMTQYWYLAILMVVGVIFLFRLYMRTDAGKMAMSKVQIKAPIIGSLMEGAYMTNFLKTFSLLIKSGVPIVDAIKLVANSTGNRLYQADLRNAVPKLERGIPFSQPLSESQNFPPLIGQMVLVGEQTGKLDEVLVTLGKFYGEMTETRVKAFSSLIEPVIIIVMGGGVAFLVFAILGPIFQASQNVGGG